MDIAGARVAVRIERMLEAALVQTFEVVGTPLCFDYFSCGEYGIPTCGCGFCYSL
jgi:hypothetical protein